MKHLYKLSLLLIFAPFFSAAQTTDGAGNGKVSLFASAAVNIETNTPGSNSPYANSGGKAYTCFLPAISFGMSVPTDATTGRVVFRLELSAAFSKYTSSYMNKIDPYIPVTASFNSMYISVVPQMLYNFYNADNLKIYGGVGVSVGTSSFSNAYYGPQDHKTLFQVTNDYDFIGFDTRVLLKAGVQIHKHVDVFFNYLTNAETTNRGFFQLNKNNNVVGVLYLF